MRAAESPGPSVVDRVAGLTEQQRRTLAALLAERAAEAGTGDARPGGDGAGRPDRLVACVTTSGSPPSAEALDAFLGERLPDYMIPSRYVRLDRFPRNAAGKLDRARVDPGAGSEIERSLPDAVGPRNETEARLLEIWKDVLEVDEVSVHDDFFEIGGDSLLSIRIISRAGRAGISIDPESFFQNPTIAGIAAAGSAAPTAEQGAVVGEAPLTPIQAWFFDRITAARDHWNQAMLLRMPRAADRDAIVRSVRALVEHHDALRLRFDATGDTRRQAFDPPGDVAVRVVDLRDRPDVDPAALIEAEADAEHRSLDLAEGHLFRVVLFNGEPGSQRLLLLAHHLLVDAVSWGILLDDLSTLLVQAAAGSPLRLPPKTLSARAWAEELEALAGSSELADASTVWLRQTPEGWARVPRDREPPSEANTMGSAATHSLSLDEADTTALLDPARRRLDAGPQELLLAALLLAWSRWAGRAGLQLDVEGHGRGVLGESRNVTRTVGWFTTVFPVALALSEATVGAAVDAVRDGFARLPFGGASHGLLRYLHPDPGLRRRLATMPRSELLFNYVGSVDSVIPPDSPFEAARDPAGQSRSADAPRAYVIEINARVERRRLTVRIEYSSGIHRPDSIGELASQLEDALRAILGARGGETSAFELAELDEAGLDRVSELLADIDD